MTKYTKYLKEILSNKRKLADFATIGLNEEGSAIVLRKLTSKLSDPGSFSVPCSMATYKLIELYVIWVLALIQCINLSIRSWGYKNPNPLTFLIFW